MSTRKTLGRPGRRGKPSVSHLWGQGGGQGQERGSRWRITLYPLACTLHPGPHLAERISVAYLAMVWRCTRARCSTDDHPSMAAHCSAVRVTPTWTTPVHMYIHMYYLVHEWVGVHVHERAGERAGEPVSAECVQSECRLTADPALYLCIHVRR